MDRLCDELLACSAFTGNEDVRGASRNDLGLFDNLSECRISRNDLIEPGAWFIAKRPCSIRFREVLVHAGKFSGKLLELIEVTKQDLAHGAYHLAFADDRERRDHVGDLVDKLQLVYLRDTGFEDHMQPGVLDDLFNRFAHDQVFLLAQKTLGSLVDHGDTPFLIHHNNAVVGKVHYRLQCPVELGYTLEFIDDADQIGQVLEHDDGPGDGPVTRDGGDIA